MILFTSNHLESLMENLCVEQIEAFNKRIQSKRLAMQNALYEKGRQEFEEQFIRKRTGDKVDMLRREGEGYYYNETNQAWANEKAFIDDHHEELFACELMPST